NASHFQRSIRGPLRRGDHGAHIRSTGGCRSRHSDSQAAAADTVCLCDYSGAAATRSDLGSNPERSSFSGIGRRKEAVNPKNFFGELKRRNVYKVAVAPKAMS